MSHTDARGSRPGRFLASELLLIVRRRRNIAGLVVLALVPVLMAVSIKIDGSSGGGPDLISMIGGNGLFVPIAALSVEIAMFLPLAIAMVAGDAVAGEANLGTLRYLLTVPVRRTRLLAVKYLAICLGALIATGLIAVVGLLVGALLFGLGPMTTLSGIQISLLGGLGRLLLIVGYLTAGLCALGAIGLFISTLTEQPIAVTVAVMIVVILMTILNAVPQLAPLHPWLITDHWTALADLLRQPMDFSGVSTGLALDAGYVVVFTLAAWARFSGKDVTA